MAKITLTKAEAFDIIRNHFGVGSGIEIDIADDPVSKDVDGWIDVPSDWNLNHAPDKAFDYGDIDIMHRDGEVENCHAMDYNSLWCQDGCECDIIKWRPATCIFITETSCRFVQRHVWQLWRSPQKLQRCKSLD